MTGNVSQNSKLTYLFLHGKSKVVERLNLSRTLTFCLFLPPLPREVETKLGSDIHLELVANKNVVTTIPSAEMVSPAAVFKFESQKII